MRLILKLIAAPFIVLLTVLVAVLLFLFSGSSFLLTAASVIMVLLGVGLFFISYPVGASFIWELRSCFRPSACRRWRALLLQG